MSRGFGTTLGVGTTDTVQTGCVANNNAAFALMVAGYRRANPGAENRLWSRNEGSFSDTFFGYSTFTNGGTIPGGVMLFSIAFSTTHGQFFFPAPALGGWHVFAIKYDPTNLAVAPSMWMDGSAQTVTTLSTPVGTVNTNTSAHLIGNRGNQDLVWDGKADFFGFWTTPPSDANLLSITGNAMYPPSAGGTLNHYLTLKDTTTNVTTGSGAPTLTGTVGLTGDDAAVNSSSYTLAAAGPNAAATLPSNHTPASLTVTLTRNTGNFAGSETLTVSGVAGWAKTAQANPGAQATATITMSCPSAAGATGTLTFSDGTITATIAVAAASFTIAPTSAAASAGATTLTFTGTNTLWQGDNPQFSISALAGTSIGASTATTNSASTATLTVGATTGTITVTDPSTGATHTFTINANGMSIAAPSPARLVANTTLNRVDVLGAATAWVSGTTFSAAGMTGTAVTAKTFVDATHVTLTLTSSTVDSTGVITITDSLDAFSATINVYSTSGGGGRGGSRALRRSRV